MTGLRPASDFQSSMAHRFREFLYYRGALSTCHEHLAVALRHLDRFLVAEGYERDHLEHDAFHRWRKTLGDRGPATQGNYIRVVRQLCLFLARHDRSTYVPEVRLVAQSHGTYRPYVYSEDEVRQLMEAALRLHDALRRRTYFMLVLLLYTAGLRIGEAVRLQLADVDHDAATLHIRKGKFGKARLVPLSAGAFDRLERFIEERRHAGAPTVPDAALFWGSRRRPYSLITVQAGLTRLIRSVCGRRPGPRGSGPRVHDLRHAMAVNRLLRWYREGVDVQARLPLIATYLGHRSFMHTQVYLTATPELLENASVRFQQSFGELITEAGGTL